MASTTACAGAMPTFLGGSTTPPSRVSLYLGGAARIPFAELRPQSDADANAVSSGLSPLAAVRYAVIRGTDLGVAAVGAVAHGTLHTRRALTSSLGWSLLLDAHGGASGGASREWVPRAGLTTTSGITGSFGGIAEGWLALRVGGEWVDSALRMSSASGSSGVVRVGAVLGVGFGFRNTYVLLECALDHEWWFALGNSSAGVAGFSVTPGFALRLTL